MARKLRAPRLRSVKMALGLVILFFGMGIGIWGLSIIASGDSPPRKEASTSLAVLLLPAPGQLQLQNNEKTDIKLWGTKMKGFPADIGEPRIVPAGNYYYILTDALEKIAVRDIGQNGEKLYPTEYYLADVNDVHFIAKFMILAKIKDGSVSFHTQQMGVLKGNWPTEDSDDVKRLIRIKQKYNSLVSDVTTFKADQKRFEPVRPPSLDPAQRERDTQDFMQRRNTASATFMERFGPRIVDLFGEMQTAGSPQKIVGVPLWAMEEWPDQHFREIGVEIMRLENSDLHQSASNKQSIR
jgi:hypothetical protein